MVSPLGHSRERFWNACLEDWTGVGREEMLGTDVRDRFPRVGERRCAARLADLFAGGAPALFSSQLHPHLLDAPLRSGRLRVLHTVAVAVPGDSATGHALLALQDVTNLADAVEALRVARDTANLLAATDPLTGGGNQRCLASEPRHATNFLRSLLLHAIPYCAVMPPSTVSMVPVAKLDSSQAR